VRVKDIEILSLKGVEEDDNGEETYEVNV